MTPDSRACRTICFVNLAHALDHFLLLIFPTAVIAIAAEWEGDYAELIGLTTGAFVAFGLFSLPFGWLADRVGRRTLLAVFFFGCGAVCFGVATAESETALALWLLALGVFTAIYHPVGSALLVANARKLGRDLGINGVFGNLGAASAPIVTAGLVGAFGWQAGFLVPGVVCILAGMAFLALVPAEGPARAAAAARSRQPAVPLSRPALLIALYGVAVVAGGFTFNMTSVSLPKVIDERLGFALPLVLVGSLATFVSLFGAVAQFSVGRLVDRMPLPRLFAGVASVQAMGLSLAALTTGVPMLLGLAGAMAAIFAQVVVNDAMVAHYVPESHRSRAFGIRYFMGFTTSGFAVPLIAVLHATAGFDLVLGVIALFGLTVFGSAAAFLAVARVATPIARAAE